MGFSRQEYWSGLPFLSPGDLPDPGIEPRSPAFQADALTSEPPGKPSKCFRWIIKQVGAFTSLTNWPPLFHLFLVSCSHVLKLPLDFVCLSRHPDFCTGRYSITICHDVLSRFSHVPTLWDPLDCSLPASSVHGFSRQKHWSGLPCPLNLLFY